MKKFIYSTFIALTIFGLSAKAQTAVNDAKAKALLKEFYMVYLDAWAIKGNRATVSKKLYALHDKYLTKKFRAQLRKIDIVDDPLRADEIIEAKNIKNFQVVKYAKRPNTYTVSYIAPVKSVNGMPFNAKAEKYILLVNEGGKLKISDVLFGLK